MLEIMLNRTIASRISLESVPRRATGQGEPFLCQEFDRLNTKCVDLNFVFPNSDLTKNVAANRLHESIVSDFRVFDRTKGKFWLWPRLCRKAHLKKGGTGDNVCSAGV